MTSVAPRGDDFGPDQIAAWFEEEREASVELAGVDFPLYYKALNEFHAWSRLPGHLGTVLALGPANGKELEAIAVRTEKFIAIEPARRWWGGGRNQRCRDRISNARPVRRDRSS